MKVRKAVLADIRKNVRLKNRLALEAGKSVATIERWIDGESDNLTKAAILQVIKAETGLSDEQILEEEVKLSEELDCKVNTQISPVQYR